MRRILWIGILVTLVVWGMTACKPGLLPTEGTGKPKVTLERVDVQSYFPWTDLPARTPLALAYVFSIENPSGYNVKLENFKFTTFFEASPGQYLSITTPTTYDNLYFPPNTVSQYRVVDVLDSFTINLSLAVANAMKIQELNLNRTDVIKNWYSKVGDFAFGIRVGEGMAVFSSEKGDIFVPFEGKFPKK
jgi:hypothetical protein